MSYILLHYYTIMKQTLEEKPEAYFYNTERPEDGVYVSTEAFVKSWLTEDPVTQAAFDAFKKQEDPEDRESEMYLMEAFGDEYGTDATTMNTYNEEYMLLDQVLQITQIDHQRVLVQFHLGGDVRGNYSTAKAYKKEHVEEMFWAMSECTMSCGCKRLDVRAGEYIDEDGDTTEMYKQWKGGVCKDCKQKVAGSLCTL